MRWRRRSRAVAAVLVLVAIAVVSGGWVGVVDGAVASSSELGGDHEPVMISHQDDGGGGDGPDDGANVLTEVAEENGNGADAPQDNVGSKGGEDGVLFQQTGNLLPPPITSAGFMALLVILLLLLILIPGMMALFNIQTPYAFATPEADAKKKNQ
mmetsp:Transcript_8036/g.17282  ORF Transcript_8036/g.17282 Transcript_8036/m.17282 type:complete len:155 (-) Transcript_8036:1226-1690(-)